MLEPRELTVPESISARTLSEMDRAIANFKNGDVSEAVDFPISKGVRHGIYNKNGHFGDTGTLDGATDTRDFTTVQAVWR